MEDLIKKEILEIEKKYNISLEESLVVFCSILAESYFINKIGVRYEKQIKRLIYSQTSVDTNKFDLKDLFLQKEMREIFDREDVDIIGNVYNKLINGEVKKIFGKFYTPAPLVQHLLDSIKLHENKNGQIIDIACGAGIFLAASIRSLIRLNNKEDSSHLLNKLIEQINGIDIDEFACRLTRLNLLISTFLIWKELLSAGGKLNINFNIKHANSLELFANEILDNKFDFVIGNPPYVESKKLPLKIKQICRKLYPEASRGAFDLYICFLNIALSLLKPNGYLGFVLPNKFLVVKYAYQIRKAILDNFHLAEICDISNLQYFDNTDVYPVLVSIQNCKDSKATKLICNIKDRDTFEEKRLRAVLVRQNFYKKFAENLPLFAFEKEIDKEILLKIAESEFPRLGNFLDIKTAVSFHFKGLREKFVSRDITAEYRYKYLGGKSYARRNEVGAFRVDWIGYYINYDVSALQKLNNPMPPLENFLRAKIIFCQHAKRMLAYADIKGEWITKDVFPIAFVKQKINIIDRTYYYTAYLNSNIFSYFYGIVYKGIQISEGYFHFLPSYTAIIPAPFEKEQCIKEIAILAEEIQAKKGSAPGRIKKINRSFYDLLTLSKEEIQRIEEYNNKYFSKKKSTLDYNSLHS